MKLVIIESPYAGDVTANVHYARKCIHDSLMRGEAPIASHLLYTQKGILNDLIPDERFLGTSAGHAWIPRADLMAVYCDLGISLGMREGINRAEYSNLQVVYRYILNLDKQSSSA